MSTFEQKIWQVLSECQESVELIALYTSPDEQDKFIVGQVAALSQRSFRLTEYSRYGRAEGSSVGLVEDILKIERSSEYLNCLQLLVENVETAMQLQDLPTKAMGAQFFDILQFSKDTKQVVTLHSRDGTTESGFVNDLGEVWVDLEILRRDGSHDGFMLMNLEEVRQIDVAQQHELRIGFLHKMRYGLIR